MNKKHKKEKSLTQLEAKEVENSEKHAITAVLDEAKRMDARAYRALFKRQPKKANMEGHHDLCRCEEIKNKNTNGNDRRDGASENVDGGGECSQRQVEELIDRWILRDSGKSLEGNSMVSEHVKETLENNGGTKSPHKCQKLTFLEEVHQFKEGDGREDLRSDDSLVLSSHRTLSKLANNVAEMEQKNLQAELANLTVNRTPGADIELESGCKVEVVIGLMPFKRKRIIDNLNSDATAMFSNKDADAASHESGRTDSVEKCPTGSKRKSASQGASAEFVEIGKLFTFAAFGRNCIMYVVPMHQGCIPLWSSMSSPSRAFIESSPCWWSLRVNHHLIPQEHCSCNPKLNDDSCGSTLAKDRGGIEADVTAGLAEQCIPDLQHKKSSLDPQFDGNPNTCLICKLGGKLLLPWARCCEGQGCKRSYHLSCLDPPLEDVPLGVWHCLACVRKKLESGIHSVSKGIESIWDSCEVEVADDNGMQRRMQFYVKYKGLAHVHNRWLPENQLLLEAPSLLAKFNQKNQVTKWKQEWTVPHRMLQKQSLMSPNNNEENCRGHSGNILACHFEWLVKWRGLDYKHATWELETASFMNSPEAQSLMRDYENRHAKAKRAEFLSRIDKLSAGGSPEFDNNHLDFVNYLREYWHKGENAVLIDDQEQITKVISFILSLSSNTRWPFLIITTPAALHSWEEELFRLAPSLYAVVYHGNKDIRKSIRKLEFYNEGGCIMFQILITSPEVIVEDLNVFESMKWEAVIVDECQRSRIHSHFEQIKVLRTAMRLLLVNGQVKDGITEHLLSLLVHQSDLNGSEGLFTNSSPKAGNLKERLLKYIANGCKPDSSKLEEYWVPVQLSPMQLEQYCATLLSNSLSLCSSSKNDPVGALRDILISSRKVGLIHL
ncbi:unnamed protein product [Dovyalis caffra]|uniref:Uncharacterized protein n=1 Tax=Dovyalis caffra TaxID=77055 RepID=A0AAV1RW54_9ROSI|nr:unnamed protein product [Dovyalis caffra]